MSYYPENDDIPPEEEVIFDLSTTCTEDEAVMRLLGWGTGHLVKRYIQVTETGISDDQLISAHPSVMSLSERLEEMQKNARQAIISAAENGAPYEELARLDDHIKHVRKIASNAVTLKRAIADELVKGGDSMLRLNEAATIKSGIPCITINSLEDWFASYKSQETTTDEKVCRSGSTASGSREPSQKIKKTKTKDQEIAILHELKNLGHSPKALPNNRPGLPGIKKQVRDKLVGTDLFDNHDIFDSAWERLRKSNRIANKD